MKACLINKYGGIEELKINDIQKPAPGSKEVLIELKSASLNHLDIWVRKGSRGSALKMPHIMGSDGAGIVREIGNNVSGIKIGDEVVLYPGLSCGHCESCLSGEQTECADFGIIGLSTPGTFAKYISVSAENVFPKPKHLNFQEASAFPLTFLTAWRMLFTKGQLKQGQTVLIHGIGGGVALAGLILAKVFGAKAIITSSSEEKLKKAKQLGADNLINYKTSSVADEVIKITNSKGVDIAFDTIGAKTFPLDFECVRKGGTIVLCGITTGASAQIDLRTLYWKQLKIFGSTMGSRTDFKALLDFINTKKLKPIIDSGCPLDQIQSATQKMEEGKQFGKIVLNINN